MSRIDEITRLLQDESAFLAYIELAEGLSGDAPSSITDGIFRQVVKKRKRFWADVAKVAACLVLSVALANTDAVVNGSDAELSEMTDTIEEKISDFYQDLTFGKDGFFHD